MGDSLDTARLWRRAMLGHAVSNVVPIVAANRVGCEHGQTFYGTSFICDERGDILAELDRSPIDENRVLELVGQALQAENAVKKKQVTMLIRLKNLLTDDQVDILEAARD